MSGIPRGICEFCNEPVDDDHTAAFRVRGWEAERSGGGANAILGRERQPDRIAHLTCVQSHLRHGAQEAML